MKSDTDFPTKSFYWVLFFIQPAATGPGSACRFWITTATANHDVMQTADCNISVVAYLSEPVRLLRATRTFGPESFWRLRALQSLKPETFCLLVQNTQQRQGGPRVGLQPGSVTAERFHKDIRSRILLFPPRAAEDSERIICYYYTFITVWIWRTKSEMFYDFEFPADLNLKKQMIQEAKSLTWFSNYMKVTWVTTRWFCRQSNFETLSLKQRSDYYYYNDHMTTYQQTKD